MKKALKLIGIAVGALFAIFIVLGIIGSIAMDNELENIENVAETENILIVYEEISADNIINLYENNELKADQLLKDARCVIAGEVVSIDVVFGQTYVILKGNDEWAIIQVQCYFDDVEADALMNVNTGDIIKIEGTVKGKGWNVDVMDCVLR